LIPRLGALKKDREGDVRARAVYGYRVLSRIIPEESLQHLSELLQDNDLNVLREVGYALLPLLGHNPIAVEYAIKLSLNPVVLDAFTEMPEHGMLRARDLEELIKSEQVYDPRASSPLPPNLTHSKVSPIIHVLRLAHASAPGLVVSHIQKCSLDKDTRLRLLAATILSDESFARSDKRLLGLRRDLENDEDYVIRDTLHSYRLLENLRRSGHVIQD
jgi:HEAT repeat protein